MGRYIFSAALAAFLIGFGGCGGSSGGTGSTSGGSSGSSGGGQAVIDNAQAVKNTFAVVGLAADASDFMDDTDPENFLPAQRALTDMGQGTQPCPKGGDVVYRVQQDADTTPVKSVVSLGFEECSTEQGLVYDGNVTYSGTATQPSDQEVTLQAFEVRDDGDVTRYDNMTIDVHVEGETAGNIKMNGTMQKIRHNLDVTHTLTLTDLTLDHDENNTFGLYGTVALQSSPTSCADGRYDINTTERLQMDENEDAVSGTVVVNGVSYHFNSDRTVTATVNGETVTFDPDQVDDINCTVVTQ